MSIEKKEQAAAAVVRHGASTAKIYEVKAPTTRAGVAYKFRIPGQRPVVRTDLEEAKREARKALQLVSQGAADATSVTVADLSELAALRRMAQEQGWPSVAAMEEWATAKKLVGSALLSAAKEHADAVADGKHERITHAEAWGRFIAAKNAAGRKGTRTYASKGKMIQRGLGAELMIDTLTANKITAWSHTVADPVTRNDLLKVLGTMLKWLQRNGLFPAERAIPSLNVDRATVPGEDPGIITPAQLKCCLDYIRASHPQYLAALALASLGGVRSDEIHGKRSDKEIPRSTMPRQRWAHIHVQPGVDGVFGWFSVSVAKKNTPSHRKVPILPALAAWLALCPRVKGEEFVCSAGAMERVRELLRKAPVELGLKKVKVMINKQEATVNDLPENAFRHSWISHRLPIVGIVQTAAEAGNSPTEIERSYRVPIDKSEALPYWQVMPD